MKKFPSIAQRPIGEGHPCYFIAEIGVNHNGKLDLALDLVSQAHQGGADAVKFQAFDPDALVTETAPQADYQARNLGVRQSQREMLAALALSAAQFAAIKVHCDQLGITFLCTPFDDESATLLHQLGCPAIKVSSGDLNNHLFLARLAALQLPIILSTGMASLDEVAAALRELDLAGAHDTILLHCVSQYPAPPECMNLRAMQTLRETFKIPTGLSDHTLGDEVSLAAVALGACMIEKHFTADRSMPGPDHAASMEPSEFAALVRRARAVESALGSGTKIPAAIEKDVANVARRSLAARRDLPAGTVLTAEDLTALRPSGGISPSEWRTVIGRRLLADLPRGIPFRQDLLQ